MNVERIKEVLEQAKGGLEWYIKNHPEMKEQIKWQETIIWALEKLKKYTQIVIMMTMAN